jgi:hypothetical protein
MSQTVHANTTTLSIRLNNTDLDELRKIAQEVGVSLNSLVNSALRNLVRQKRKDDSTRRKRDMFEFLSSPEFLNEKVSQEIQSYSNYKSYYHEFFLDKKYKSN